MSLKKEGMKMKRGGGGGGGLIHLSALYLSRKLIKLFVSD